MRIAVETWPRGTAAGTYRIYDCGDAAVGAKRYFVAGVARVVDAPEYTPERVARENSEQAAIRARRIR